MDTISNKAKFYAAKEWAKKKNMFHIVITEEDIEILTLNDLVNIELSGQLKWTDKYKEMFVEYKRKNSKSP